MTAFSWRIRFGDRPASRAEMAQVEEIVVEQEMDMAWEARVRLTLSTDDAGRWRSTGRSLAAPFSRVRVEGGIDGRFTPLIDGPVAGVDTRMDARPGRSSVTLVVRDDSTLLNRDEATEVFENRPDHQVAAEIFGRHPAFIGETRIEPTSATPPAAVRRGTEMAFLRELARVHGWHAWVLPGPVPGRSVGCFGPAARAPGRLPALRLLGRRRTLAEFTVTEDAERPARVRTRVLSFADRSVTDATSSSRDRGLMRPLPALSDDQTALRQLPPEAPVRDDPQLRSGAEAARARWAYRAEGRVESGCYAAALAPYERIRIEASTSPHSGDWLLTRVVHRITPAGWEQRFEARTDSRTDAGAPPRTGPGGGLSVDLATELNLF